MAQLTVAAVSAWQGQKPGTRSKHWLHGHQKGGESRKQIISRPRFWSRQRVGGRKECVSNNHFQLRPQFSEFHPFIFTYILGVPQSPQTQHIPDCTCDIHLPQPVSLLVSSLSVEHLMIYPVVPRNLGVLVGLFLVSFLSHPH